MAKCKLCHHEFDIDSLLKNEENDSFYCKDCSNQGCGDTLTLNTIETKSSKMFTDVELQNISKINIFEKEVRSKRPLRCLHNNCNKYVSIFGLNSHIQFDHNEIPIISINFEESNHFVFNISDITAGVTQYLVAFKIININSSSESQPTIIVCATRLIEDDADDGENQLNIWASSNISTNYSYTLVVSNVSSNVKVEYHGPILQVKDLYLEESCLTLNNFQIEGLSEVYEKHLSLDVTIHSEHFSK